VRDDVVVGIAQWLPAPGRLAENLDTAVRYIGDLARRGADLIVLPELWPCGFDWSSLHRDAAGAAETLDGPRCAALAACARDLGVWLAAGSVPENHDGALYNTALLFDRHGRLRAWHRKAHLYSPLGETEIFTPGDQLTVCPTGEFGMVGLTVCFDGDFPEVARAMRGAGAKLIIQPCAYEAAAAAWWRTLYPAHALSNGQWWVLANQCGTNPSGTLLGESQVISPSGDVLARARRAHNGETPPAELMTVPVPLTRELAGAEHDNGVLWRSRRPGLEVQTPGRSLPGHPWPGGRGSVISTS
jgi:predicted amidohydrolase